LQISPFIFSNIQASNVKNSGLRFFVPHPVEFWGLQIRVAGYFQLLGE